MNPSQQKTETYDETKKSFVADVMTAFSTLKDEITERNNNILRRDQFIYSDRLERVLDIPFGHDHTPVNWLRRTVEIHKNMFMGRGFGVSSTYNIKDLSSAADDNDRKRLEIENQKEKSYAEARMDLIKSIKEDNSGDAFWATAAENASAVGDVAIKQYWDEEQKKVVQSQIENVENFYALWSRDDFRQVDAYAYIYQVSKQDAIRDYGAPDDVATSPLGDPTNISGLTSNPTTTSSRPMVTIMEITGRIEGWGTQDGRLVKVDVGKETELNALIVGSTITRLITDENKIPKYYILPNKRQRKRAWGESDITDAAIQINLTYVETLSDWRTVSAKVNYPKYKAFGFSAVEQLPKYEPRKVQIIPLSEEQDLQELSQTDANGNDWSNQLDELESQYIREAGISRVLFDDPSVTLNSNQALVTSMKTTTDIAEAKKQLWEPIIKQIYKDALEMAANHMPEVRDSIVTDEDWSLKIMWPSVMDKDDPNYQSMLINQFNAGLLSVQSYMETTGKSKEEIDRIREEMTDPITAAILGHQTPLIAQALINAATAEIQAWFQMMQPQPAPQAGAPTTPTAPGIPGGAPEAQIATTEQNQPGQQPVSQPGTGATSASPVGAVVQANQNAGV